MTPADIDMVCAEVESAAAAKVLFRPGTTATAWAVVGSRIGVAAIALCDYARPSGVQCVRTVAVDFTADEWAAVRDLAEQVAR